MIGKDLEQSLNHSCEEPTSNWLKDREDSLKWFWESRTQDSEQIQRSQWQDTRNQQSSVLYFTSWLFPSLFSDGLSLKTFFLKASTLREGVQATHPRVLHPEGISNKERKDWRHQSSRVFSEWPTSDHVYNPRSAILAGPWGPIIGFTCGLVALTQQHTWLSISSRTTRLKLGRGSSKESDWEIV